MRRSIYIGAAAFSIATAFAAGWLAQGWRAEAELFNVRREYAELDLRRSAAALESYIRMEGVKNAAIKEAEARAASNAAAAASARTAADSLRRDIAGVPGRIAAATDAAVREYAGVAGQLLGDCTAQYQRVAAEADQHSSDVQLMMDSWPK